MSCDWLNEFGAGMTKGNKRPKQVKYKDHPRVEMTPEGKRALIQPWTPASARVTTGRLVSWTADGYIRICRDYHRSVDVYYKSFWKVL